MPSIKPSINVYAATFGALLGALSMGLSLGYTAPAFLDMEENLGKAPLDLDPTNRESQKSLIGSILAIGALFGGLLGEPANKFFGRRVSLIVYGIPFAVGWCLIAMAQNVTMIVIGRVLTGLCSGLSSATAPTYVVEIAPPKIRGLLGTCFQMMINLGILMAAVFGTFLSWRTLAICSMVPSAGMSFIMLFMPETPQWLLAGGHETRAQASLTQLRSSPIECELNSMVEAAKKAQQTGGTSYSWSLIKSQEFYKPALFSIGLMFFQQFSGINAVLFYQTDIFSKVAPKSDASQSTILVCLTQSITTCIGSLMIDRLGRRALLIVSGIGHAIALFIFGYYCHISIENKTFQAQYAWLASASIIAFIVFFSIGFGPIAWLMIPELTSARVRSLVASLATAFNWTCVYIVTATFKTITSSIGDAWTYWTFAILCLTSCLFAYFILPETRDKSTEQIQLELSSPSELTDQGTTISTNSSTATNQSYVPQGLLAQGSVHSQQEQQQSLEPQLTLPLSAEPQRSSKIGEEKLVTEKNERSEA